MAETWEPDNRLGYVTSVATAAVVAAFLWWIGIVDLGTEVVSLSPSRVVAGLVLGLLAAAGMLAVLAIPAWRDRWASSVRFRIAIGVPVSATVAVLLAAAPAVVSIAAVSMALVFVVGRTYLYVDARRSEE